MSSSFNATRLMAAVDDVMNGVRHGLREGLMHHNPNVLAIFLDVHKPGNPLIELIRLTSGSEAAKGARKRFSMAAEMGGLDVGRE